MAILPAEINVFPADLLERLPGTALLDQDTSGDGFQDRWWAVHTKPRQEKSVARCLVDLSIPFYLPVIAKSSMVAGRRRMAHVPLFDSYLFVYGSPQQRLDVLNTRRCVQAIEVSSRHDMCADLRNVDRLIRSGLPLTPEARLQPGQRVRVKSGALMGVEGWVLSRRGGDRLMIAVDFIQQGASILIQDFQLERVG